MKEVAKVSEKGVPAVGHATSGGSDFRKALLEYIRVPAFKRLLNQVASIQAKRSIKSIAILSEYPEEGRSFFVSALSLAYATMLSKRVLIVDTVSQVRNRSLFMECLIPSPDEGRKNGKGSIHGAIDLITTKESEEESQEVIDFHMKSHIESFSDGYDVVLFDTCAMSAADKDNMDPIVIARDTDAVILLTSPRSLDRDLMSRLVGDFKRWEIQIIGTVFNPGPSA